MADMAHDIGMHAALVLFEGLPPTVIDSQVLTHVRLVRDELGIDLSVISVAFSRAMFELSQARLEQARAVAGGEVQLIRGLRPAMPGSLTINRLLLGRALKRLRPLSFIHARADYAAAVAGLWGRQHGVPVLWDCRGDSCAEMQERLGGASALFRYRSHLFERELHIAGKSCAGALFVTPQLRDLMAPHIAGQPTEVIPCLAPEAEFYFDPSLRDRVRADLAIAPDEVVYVYSGSLNAYQRFDETVATFRAALAAGRKARLIVLTPEVARARRICADLPAGRVICKSVTHAEVNGYLNAADFGMLLRDTTPTNVVAFPTKFAEYAMTGLKVVMKEAPPACVAAARELGNYSALGAQAAPLTAAERAPCAAQARQRLGRRAAMPLYAGIYQDLARAKAR
jgi:glycosyltransferase involved in cell wall biosynthesis